MTVRESTAIGLDLGSTTIKAGLLDERGKLAHVESTAAPELRGNGLIREGDPEAYAAAAHRLLASIEKLVPRETPLGIASQRSTFTIWDRRSGRPVLPMISWQDRRGADWCDRRKQIEPEIIRRTGLLLSAHYVGPKLAALQEAGGGLICALGAGDLLFGTLESFLIWRWSSGRIHETDLTMAARTLLVDLTRPDWSDELLQHFDVPRTLLPRVVPSCGRQLRLDSRTRVAASLADQAASALSALGPNDHCVLVNLGTGGFVMRLANGPGERKPGYLTGPVLSAGRGDCRYGIEGTINGCGPAVDRFGSGPTELPGNDPGPEAFCLPDLAGLGSPHWRPEIGLTFSPAARRLETREKRRIVLEGVLFRIVGILQDLCNGETSARVRLSGGLAREPFIGQGLASVLGRPVERFEEPEGSLLGASRLAAGLPPATGGRSSTIHPVPAGAYLPGKFRRWTRWFVTLVSN